MLVAAAPSSASRVDADGAAPLHVAASRGRTSCVAALLRAGADCEALWRGQRAVDLARSRGHGHVARLLATRAIGGADRSESPPDVTPDDGGRLLARDAPCPSPAAANGVTPDDIGRRLQSPRAPKRARQEDPTA